jgi:hypothetical protein
MLLYLTGIIDPGISGPKLNGQLFSGLLSIDSDWASCYLSLVLCTYVCIHKRRHCLTVTAYPYDRLSMLCTSRMSNSRAHPMCMSTASTLSNHQFSFRQSTHQPGILHLHLKYPASRMTFFYPHPPTNRIAQDGFIRFKYTGRYRVPPAMGFHVYLCPFSLTPCQEDRN